MTFKDLASCKLRRIHVFFLHVFELYLFHFPMNYVSIQHKFFTFFLAPNNI